MNTISTKTKSKPIILSRKAVQKFDKIVKDIESGKSKPISFKSSNEAIAYLKQLK